MKALPGNPTPLGVSRTKEGLNFALFSENATAVSVVLFSASNPAQRLHTISLDECTDHVWHGVVAQAAPGLRYGYEVQGPYQPEAGHRFVANLVLLDPYARQVVPTELNGTLRPLGEIPTDQQFEVWAKKEHAFTPQSRPPLTDLLLYETHVRGISMLHPDVPASERGTFLGAAHPKIIEHLRRMGVGAVEFLPVQMSWPEEYLANKGLTNYWGYNTLNFFAPDPRFGKTASSPAEVLADFQTMVERFHAAGIEVILDVVYNHTAEGDQRGPTLSFRGIDNLTYYRLEPDDLSAYENLSWCGNTLDVRHGRVLQLIAESLRWWVVVMGVDGFRFDLAGALARENIGFTRGSGFFDIVLQDPVLSSVRLIAEPWDPGPFGYQAGNFPAPWREWNGEYRDSVRKFWRGEKHTVGELAARLSGSEDLYRASGRGVSAGVNFITCHDGFTLADLVSYNEKNNLSNGEENRDGSPENFSWNCGVEGPTDNTEIMQLRQQQMRNLLLTVLVSQGTPLVLGGDELGRTQNGNNNAYCHDNELNWHPWQNLNQPTAVALARLSKLRKENAVLRRRSFLTGQVLPIGAAPRPGTTNDGSSRTNQSPLLKDVHWLHPHGREMTPADWQSPDAAVLGMVLPREGLVDRQPDGSLPASASLAVLLNASEKDLTFVLPELFATKRWYKAIDTANHAEWQGSAEPIKSDGATGRAGEQPGSPGIEVRAHAAVVLLCDD